MPCSCRRIALLITIVLVMAASACSESSSAGEKSNKAAATVNFVMEPFIINLSTQGGQKFLKIAIAMELSDASVLETAKKKTAALRDAIIGLISSKSAEDILAPEGKMQFKDEVLLQANQIIKQGSVKNIYFTELIMQ